MGAEGLLIVRFGPFTAEGCRKNALGTFDDDVAQGKSGRYGVSVYGIVPAPEEEADDALKRLCSEVPVTGRSIAVIPADALEAKEWLIDLDIPPDNHYLIGQNDFSRMPDVDALEILWSSCRRKNPAWKGS